MSPEPEVDEFAGVFAGLAPALRRTAFVIVRDWHLAEDMVQQAMAKMYVAWPRVRPETRDAYARRVLVNECLTHLRRRRPEQLRGEFVDLDMRGFDARSGDEAGRRDDLVTLLGLLPPRQRAVVALRFVDDLGVADVARVLGVTEGTVKSQTARALTALRAHLTDPTYVQEC